MANSIKKMSTSYKAIFIFSIFMVFLNLIFGAASAGVAHKSPSFGMGMFVWGYTAWLMYKQRISDLVSMYEILLWLDMIVATIVIALSIFGENKSSEYFDYPLIYSLIALVIAITYGLYKYFTGLNIVSDDFINSELKIKSSTLIKTKSELWNFQKIQNIFMLCLIFIVLICGSYYGFITIRKWNKEWEIQTINKRENQARSCNASEIKRLEPQINNVKFSISKNDSISNVIEKIKLLTSEKVEPKISEDNIKTKFISFLVKPNCDSNFEYFIEIIFDESDKAYKFMTWAVNPPIGYLNQTKELDSNETLSSKILVEKLTSFSIFDPDEFLLKYAKQKTFSFDEALVPDKPKTFFEEANGWTQESTGSKEIGPWLDYSPKGTRYCRYFDGVIQRLYPPGVKPKVAKANPFCLRISTPTPQ